MRSGHGITAGVLNQDQSPKNLSRADSEVGHWGSDGYARREGTTGNGLLAAEQVNVSD